MVMMVRMISSNEWVGELLNNIRMMNCYVCCPLVALEESTGCSCSALVWLFSCHFLQALVFSYVAMHLCLFILITLSPFPLFTLPVLLLLCLCKSSEDFDVVALALVKTSSSSRIWLNSITFDSDQWEFLSSFKPLLLCIFFPILWSKLLGIWRLNYSDYFDLTWTRGLRLRSKIILEGNMCCTISYHSH